MTEPFPTVAVLLAQARRTIDAADAELLLAHALQHPRSWLFAHAGDAVDGEAQHRFHDLLAQRAAGTPVAYLTGTRGFWTLDLAVTPATLIPRPETELLVELALARLPADIPVQVADLGTGSGAIALALASERPHAQVVATDASATALEVAQENARRNQLPNADFREGDWFAPLRAERFHMIVSNPPYIAAADRHLSEGDVRFEPSSALVAGADGLDDIRLIIQQAPDYLEAGGWLLLEHGYDQAEVVAEMMRAAGWQAVESLQDLLGHFRVTLGRRSVE